MCERLPYWKGGGRRWSKEEGHKSYTRADASVARGEDFVNYGSNAYDIDARVLHCRTGLNYSLLKEMKYNYIRTSNLTLYERTCSSYILRPCPTNKWNV